MPDVVNYGVIGLGWFEEKHYEVLAGMDQVKIFSLCTR